VKSEKNKERKKGLSIGPDHADPTAITEHKHSNLKRQMNRAIGACSIGVDER